MDNQNEKITIDPKLNMTLRVMKGNSPICDKSKNIEFRIPASVLLISTIGVLGLVHGTAICLRIKAEKNNAPKPCELMEKAGKIKNNMLKKAKKFMAF